MTRPVTLALQRYRTVLPASEFTALKAWASSFWPFQRAWLFESASLSICNKARQIGMSHTTAAVGVLWGAFHGELTTIISIGQPESDEVLEKCKRHIMLLRRCGSQLAGTVRDNKSEIVFENGGRILALPSTGGRGFTGNVFLDEFAYQEHAGKVWDAAAPVTLLGGKMRVSSTPNGIGNEFHGLWERAQQEGSAWQPYEIPLKMATDCGYRVDMKKCWELAKGDPRIFDQLFNCSFLDNEFQYIPSEVIAACCVDEGLEAPEDGDYYAGLDIGRTNDLTVLVVVRYVNKRRYLVFVDSMKRTDSDGLEAMVARAFERFKLKRLCIDSTGLGYFPAERMKKKHSERIDVPHRRPRVELVDFTPNNKEDLATGLYAAMTSSLLFIPRTDEALPGCKRGTADRLRKDIAAIRRIVTASGNVRYDAPRTREGHADHAWGLALAVHACSKVNPMIEALTQKAS